MNFKKLITTILAITLTSNLSFGQDLITCTQSHDKAYRHVKFYLTSPDLQNERINFGTNNIPVEQIRHVDDEAVCIKLNAILKSNVSFKEIDEEPDLKKKFYYQTDNFYYIFWDYTDDKIRFGPKTIFIVVNKAFVVVGTCYM